MDSRGYFVKGKLNYGCGYIYFLVREYWIIVYIFLGKGVFFVGNIELWF